MEIKMTNLEKALLHAARAFIAVLEGSEGSTQATPQAPQRKAPQAAPTETSNGVKVCPKHGKAHRPSKSGNGTYCLDCYLEKKNG